MFDRASLRNPPMKITVRQRYRFRVRRQQPSGGSPPCSRA